MIETTPNRNAGGDHAAQAPAHASMVRFAIVSVVAFSVDMALSLALRITLQAPLWLATGVSFLLVGALAYFVHEHWSFARPGARSHPGRLAAALVVSAAAVSARMAVVAGMEALHSPGVRLAAVYLIACGAVSMALNYGLNRVWVYRSID